MITGAVFRAPSDGSIILGPPCFFEVVFPVFCFFTTVWGRRWGGALIVYLDPNFSFGVRGALDHAGASSQNCFVLVLHK